MCHKRWSLRSNLKYILPFFIVCSLIIAGDQYFTTYKFSNFIRQSEYVHVAQLIHKPSKSCILDLSKNSIDRNRYKLFQCNDLHEYFISYIGIRLANQKRYTNKTKDSKWIITKVKNPKDNDEDHLTRFIQLYQTACAGISTRLDCMMKSCKWNLISIQKCQILSELSFGHLIYSRDLQNVLDVLCT